MINDERRELVHPVSTRAATDTAPAEIEGYAAVFNEETTIGGRHNAHAWREQIAPGAFDGVDASDVVALLNHDPNLLLGRTGAGTLRLAVDDRGLRYTITPPDTTIGRDTLALVQRGDLVGSSFGFIVDADEWEAAADGLPRRTITRATVLDVSPVTFPAYPQTTVQSRDRCAGLVFAYAADVRRRRLRLQELIARA